MAKHDEKMIENIKNYSNEIVTLDSFVDAVRKMPGMYIGYLGAPGTLNMFREIFQNSIDELMKDSSPCTFINVFYDERDPKRFIIEDNGRGIPFSDMIRIFSSEHTSSNYNKKEGEFSSGRHGVGSKVANALSKTFTVKSYILGEARQVDFIDGIPSKKEIYKIPNDNNLQGTIVEFSPSYEVMGNIDLSIMDVLELIEMIVPLTKLDAVVNFSAIDKSGNPFNKKIINEDGIISYLIMKTTSPLIKPIIYNKVTGTMKAEIAFTYDSDDLKVEDITSFSNYCPTTTGTHYKGFADGVSKYFKDYMNKIYLSNNNKISIVDSDIKTGLKAIISVAHLNPIFTGQAKEILSNNDMYGFVKYLTIEYLEQWSKDNPSDLQKLCKYFNEVAKIRLKSEEGKVKLTNKYKASVLSGLPAKYAKPSGKEHLELIICEGDSALGSARNSRCRERQGLFPIKGKIPNAFTTTKKDFLSNDEVAGIITLVGGGYGKSFDIDKVQWESIILMADADKDGNHIDNLLMKMFLLYMRPVIEHGRLYRAVPPLYGAKKNGKFIYFTDKLDFVRYTQKIFSRNNKISNIKGKTLSELEVMDLLYKNIEYIYELETIANRYAINPNLLELIIINKNNSNFKDIIEKTYRFIKIEKKNNVVVVSGLIDSKYQTVFITDQFIYDIKYIIDIIDNNEYKHYYVNNELLSLYSIMKLFERNKPNSVIRYKGLGEMNPSQLADSTLHPDSNRTLIRYTIEDVEKEIEAIRYLESNKYELIKDVNVSRFDILG